jgi:hypothetical protein
MRHITDKTRELCSVIDLSYHPNIVTSFGISTVQGEKFMFSEFVESGNLA